MEPADIIAKVERQGFWTVTTISNFIGCERGTTRRMFLRGRLGAEMISRGIRSPRGQRRFADTAAFRWELGQIREYHNRPDKKFQPASRSRRSRIEKLAAICRGEVATDPLDKEAAVFVLKALAVLWDRTETGQDAPALRGALDFAPVVRSKARRGDERLFLQICQAATMLEKGNATSPP